MKCSTIWRKIFLHVRSGVFVPVGSGEFFVREISTVKDVMLENEKYVKEDREKTKSELGWISEDGTPVIVVVRNQEHLEDAEEASGEVEKDIADAPSRSALPPKIHVRLGDVLDEGDSELDVGAVVEEVEPRDDTRERENETDPDEDGDPAENTATDFRHFL